MMGISVRRFPALLKRVIDGERILRRSVIIFPVLLLAAACAGGHHHGHDGRDLPGWQLPTSWPDRVIANATKDPLTSFSVSWRTDATVSTPTVQLVEANDNSRFDLDAIQFVATTEALNLDTVAQKGARYGNFTNQRFGTVHFHSVIFEDLKPGTTYAYRVRGAERHWSEWYHITTAAGPDKPLRFLYFGDAQNGVLSHWSRVIRSAFAAAPDADFIIHAGDLVERASRDFEWAEWFKAGGFIHGRIPSIPVPGNHEYDAAFGNGFTISGIWRPQFRLPESNGLPDSLKETVYDIQYPQAHIFVLDTNVSPDLIATQAQWLNQKLSETDANWTIVTSHFPIFSSGSGRDNPQLRKILLPVLNEHQVDLVLQGHDHTYARGATAFLPKMMAPKHSPTEGEVVTTVYVNSVSGPKSYANRRDGWEAYRSEGVVLNRVGTNMQFFHVVDIDDENLEFATYTALGEKYDAFRLQKADSGGKSLIELTSADTEIVGEPSDPPTDFTDLLEIYPE